jgi:hypothetical protein
MKTLLRLGIVATLGLASGSMRTLADGCCTLRGQVVSSAGGAPVRGALVQLTGEAPQSAMTAADGTFAIANLKPGEFTVRVKKPGYFTPDQLDPSLASPVSLHLDANTGPILVKLIPEGVVSGRILDESGEPVEGMQVRLQAEKNSMGPGPVSRSGLPDAQSNEIGEFRIAGIQPGSYLLITTARAEQTSEFVEQVESVRQNRRDYPVTYYPGTINRSQAARVHVKAGSAQRLDIRVAKQPFYRIAGRVNAVATPEGIVVVLVSLASRRPFGVIRGTTDGTFVFPDVSPGEYLLWAVTDPNGDSDEENVHLGLRYLNVTGNVTGLAVPMAKVANTEVDLHWELSHGTHGEAPTVGESLPIYFARVDSPVDLLQMLRVRSPEDEHGVSHSFFEPGTYRLRVRPEAKEYVARATSGGTDLLREDLVVGAGSMPAPIEIVLRDDGAAIKGHVAGSASNEEGRVYAVPAERPTQAVSTSVASDGSFHLGNLPPGRYSIVALLNAETLDLGDAQSVTRAERMGESTDLQADATSTLQLEWKRWNE